jgi:[lysine-biosynthesis-protein LysW]--L-2-aminoadipate ligase
VAFSPEKALEAFRMLGGKAVIKPVVGSWGRMVALLDSYYSAKAVIEEREYMDPLYQVYYLQEFVNRPPRDIRAFVVGDQVIAAIYRNQPEGDFRTNTALGGRAENCPVTREIEDLALRAARAIGDGVYGVDMMETENGVVVHEVNGTVEFKNSVSVTGVDIPGKIIEYAVNRVKR